ncbi:MAG TPA: choice-of-anchor J domain-containing protein [Bacteroidia bacterium]|nr:choice-of-anchor J domain-containing protein [Bacteroidia bacterium]
MKKIYTSLCFIILLCPALFSQTTLLSESFTSPFSVAGSGWLIQNNSNPIGTLTWAQGVGTIFPAYSGAADDYFEVNYNCQGSASGDISNFLITPTVSLMNGAVLKFATRTTSNPSNFPDRLEVRMSIGTGTGSIANTVNAVGTFTSVLVTVNPGLSTTGYPAQWTIYTSTLAGISGTQTGRFAFRYYVTNGGPNGANSDYIGLDDVEYTTSGPCPTATITVNPSNTTICQGNAVQLVAGGASTYTWNTGSHNTSIMAQPNSTTVYTVTGTAPGLCPGVATATVTVVQPPNLVTSPNVTACPGGTVLLTASGANSYTWSNGVISPTIVLTVNSNTYINVIGETAVGCTDFAYVSITTNTFLNISNPPPQVCPGQTLILGASGANTYTWNTGSSSPSIVITPTNSGSYFVSGNNGNCTETRYVFITVDPVIFAPSFTTCSGITTTLFASGASSYQWSNGATSAQIVLTPTASTAFTVTGTTGSCSVVRIVSVTVSNFLSVNASQVCMGTSLLLSAYGANSYTWYPILDNSPSLIITPTATAIYTLAGTSGTCSGTRTIQITYCAGEDEIHADPFADLMAYPNPFQDRIQLKNAFGQLKVLNAMGQLIMSQELEGEFELNTTEFAQGSYFLIISQGGLNKRKVLRLIKN